MRTFSLLAFVLLLSTSFTLKNPESNPQELTEAERLYHTCKIWGLMKYYHPLVARGAYNWDDKLQNLIRLTSGRNTYEGFSEFYERYLYNLGQVPPCANCSKESIDENFNLSWTQNPKYSAKLRATLKQLGENPYQGKPFYVGFGDAGQFEPRNEGPDVNFSIKDRYQRILPLFRVWNYVEYFYPHKEGLDKSWDDVLREMIPVFLEADTKLKLHLAILQLLVSMDDSHSGLVSYTLDQYPYYTFLPARFEWIEEQVVITEILDEEKAAAADLQVGDIILSINGKPAPEVHEANKKYIWGSNNAGKNRSLYATLFMGQKAGPVLEIQRADEVFSVSATLYKFNDFNYEKENSGPKWELIGDSIGYVDMSKLSTSDVSTMMEEFREQAFIIFDVRNGGKGAYKVIASYLNPSDTIFAKIKTPDPKYPGKFLWSAEQSCGEQNSDPYPGSVILLVNEKTQNSDEFGCMCLQTAPRVTVIGSQTAGAVGNVSKFAVVDRLFSSMTGISIHYPDGQAVQRDGIKPSLVVQPTLAAILEGRDGVLEEAVDFAEQKIAMAISLKQQMNRLETDTVAVDSLELEVEDY